MHEYLETIYNGGSGVMPVVDFSIINKQFNVLDKYSSYISTNSILLKEQPTTSINSVLGMMRTNRDFSLTYSSSDGGGTINFPMLGYFNVEIYDENFEDFFVPLYKRGYINSLWTLARLQYNYTLKRLEFEIQSDRSFSSNVDVVLFTTTFFGK